MHDLHFVLLRSHPCVYATQRSLAGYFSPFTTQISHTHPPSHILHTPLHRRQRLPQASEFFSKLLPHWPEAAVYVAAAERSLGDPARAINVLQDRIDTAGASCQLLTALGSATLEGGDPWFSVLCAAEALDLDPTCRLVRVEDYFFRFVLFSSLMIQCTYMHALIENHVSCFGLRNEKKISSRFMLVLTSSHDHVSHRGSRYCANMHLRIPTRRFIHNLSPEPLALPFFLSLFFLFRPAWYLLSKALLRVKGYAAALKALNRAPPPPEHTLTLQQRLLFAVPPQEYAYTAPKSMVRSHAVDNARIRCSNDTTELGFVFFFSSRIGQIFVKLQLDFLSLLEKKNHIQSLVSAPYL